MTNPYHHLKCSRGANELYSHQQHIVDSALFWSLIVATLSAFFVVECIFVYRRYNYKYRRNDNGHSNGSRRGGRNVIMDYENENGCCWKWSTVVSVLVVVAKIIMI